MDSDNEKSVMTINDSLISAEAKVDENPKKKSKAKKVYAVSLKKPVFMLNRKDLVLEVARDLFARQKWSTFRELTTRLLITDTRIPGFALMRHFFVFLYAEDARRLNISELRIFIKNFLFLLDNQKYEFLIELAVYILKNDQVLLSEKPFLIDLRNDMEKRMRRVTWSKGQMMLRKTYQLYEEYLEFIEWKTQNDPRNFAMVSVHSSINANSYMSSVLEHLSNKIKENLNRLISNNQHVEMNLDIGVLMLLQLYDHDSELIEALELLEKYALNNPDNLNAHIYIVEFLARFPDIPHNFKIRINSLKHIVRLCPDSRYTIRLVREQPVVSGLTVTERLQMLVDFVDYKVNQRLKRAWKLLDETLSAFISSSDNDITYVQHVQLFFTDRLLYWERIHFNLSELQSVLPKLRQYHQGRSSTDYNSDISSASDSSFCLENYQNTLLARIANTSLSRQSTSQQRPTSSDAAISKHDYHLYLYKGNVLGHLSQLEIPLSPNLEQYKEILATL